LLADMGARVIKIESPAGDDLRWAIDGRSRTFQGKESLVLDLKQPEGREIIHKLLARADAVMHNMRGDAAARLGIDFPTAAALNPDVVYLYAGSYGSTGPGAGRAARTGGVGGGRRHRAGQVEGGDGGPGLVVVAEGGQVGLGAGRGRGGSRRDASGGRPGQICGTSGGITTPGDQGNHPDSGHNPHTR
ncbi:MAG: CoA transferase, partial [Acidimicrobiales bacterium]